MRPAPRVRERLAPLLLAAAVVACGGPESGPLGRATLAESAPAVEAFASDLDAGRIDAALARTTRAFQSSAAPQAVRSVLDSLRRALGASRSRTPQAVESLVTEGDPARVREAVLRFDAAFERGHATVRARVQRDATRDGWLVDGYEVKSDLFTWTLRK